LPDAAGCRILVRCTGGVSEFAIQIASAFDAKVIDTSSRDENIAARKPATHPDNGQRSAGYAEFRIMLRDFAAVATGRRRKRYDPGIIRRTELDVNLSNCDLQLDSPPQALFEASK
jgi:NADPH:quinone reductase-like Zn-dependent oxidoreductase